jgi:hypothetical protein
MLRLDIVINIIVMGVLMLALIAPVSLVVRSWRSNGIEDHNLAEVLSVFLGVILIFIMIIIIFQLAPFNPKYWTINQYHGTVTSISKTVVSTGDGGANATPSFLIHMKNSDGRPDGNAYLSTDTRLLGYGRGDDLSLACTWDWNYAAADKLECTVSK